MVEKFLNKKVDICEQIYGGKELNVEGFILPGIEIIRICCGFILLKRGVGSISGNLQRKQEEIAMNQ